MDHLVTTRHFEAQVVSHPDRQLVDPLVELAGNLESLIRNQPDDHPVINAGPLEDLPVTKLFVNMMENAMPRYQVRSDAASACAAASIVAIKVLETRIRDLEARFH